MGPITALLIIVQQVSALRRLPTGLMPTEVIFGLNSKEISSLKMLEGSLKL